MAYKKIVEKPTLVGDFKHASLSNPKKVQEKKRNTEDLNNTFNKWSKGAKRDHHTPKLENTHSFPNTCEHFY